MHSAGVWIAQSKLLITIITIIIVMLDLRVREARLRAVRRRYVQVVDAVEERHLRVGKQNINYI